MHSPRTHGCASQGCSVFVAVVVAVDVGLVVMDDVGVVIGDVVTEDVAELVTDVVGDVDVVGVVVVVRPVCT